NKLNAHNQYLSFLIKGGIIAIAIFLVTLIIGFKKAIRYKSAIFISFLVCISVVSISENILDVNKGIFFYSFFLSFFTVPGLVKPADSKATDAENQTFLQVKPYSLEIS
ncbi:MAG TPA: hypothetical protein VNS32_17210, partial [Flavisolibacter sp.]|nr:hypothetical protein [Flavisolibacter sp.]